jgi:hypothetical protein
MRPSAISSHHQAGLHRDARRSVLPVLVASTGNAGRESNVSHLRHQTFTFRGHAIFTGGGALPQRFGYVGGSSTLPTVDLLALGGDHLLFLGGEYRIPFDQINLPYVGNPYLSLRYEAGNAGVDAIPTLIQNLGVSLGVSFLRIDYTLDPASNRSPFSRRSVFSASLSLSP